MFKISECGICDKGVCQVCTRQCIICDQLRCSKCCIETYLLYSTGNNNRGGDREPVCLECIAELKRRDEHDTESEMEQNGV
jgi:hypothetical protein